MELPAYYSDPQQPVLPLSYECFLDKEGAIKEQEPNRLVHKAPHRNHWSRSDGIRKPQRL